MRRWIRPAAGYSVSEAPSATYSRDRGVQVAAIAERRFQHGQRRAGGEADAVRGWTLRGAACGFAGQADEVDHPGSGVRRHVDDGAVFRQHGVERCQRLAIGAGERAEFRPVGENA